MFYPYITKTDLCCLLSYPKRFRISELSEISGFSEHILLKCLKEYNYIKYVIFPKNIIPLEEDLCNITQEKYGLKEISDIIGFSIPTTKKYLIKYNLYDKILTYGEALSKSLLGRNVNWGHKIGNSLRGRKRPGIKGREKGCIGWSKGLRKTTDKRIARGCLLEKHWNWKGGISKEFNRLRQTSEYKNWRYLVYKRDNWICQECGKNSHHLNAHHIELLSELLKRYNIKNVQEAIKCKELWNIENGITLCKNCHINLHKELRKCQDHWELP